MRFLGRCLLASITLLSYECSGLSAAELTNTIGSYRLTLLNGKGGVTWGWVQLVKPDGTTAGFIYLDPEEVSSEPPRLNADNTYIVTHMPMSKLQNILYVLDTAKIMQIRFAEAGAPTAFLETSSGAQLSTERSTYGLDAEQSAYVATKALSK